MKDITDKKYAIATLRYLCKTKNVKPSLFVLPVGFVKMPVAAVAKCIKQMSDRLCVEIDGSYGSAVYVTFNVMVEDDSEE